MSSGSSCFNAIVIFFPLLAAMASVKEGDDAMRLKLAVALALWRASKRSHISGVEENGWRKKVCSATL